MAERPFPQPRVPPGSPEDTRTWTDPGFHISPRHDVVRLNPRLAAWALRLTRATPLMDTPAMQRQRASYAGFPRAQQPPSVMIGGSLSTQRFLIGSQMDRWASHWMPYMTDSHSEYYTAGENDIGSLVAIESLGQAGKADPNRVLLLRTASDFTEPPPNTSLTDFISAEQHGSYTGYDAAIEALYRVGSPVVHRLLGAPPRLDD